MLDPLKRVIVRDRKDWMRPRAHPVCGQPGEGSQPDAGHARVILGHTVFPEASPIDTPMELILLSGQADTLPKLYPAYFTLLTARYSLDGGDIAPLAYLLKGMLRVFKNDLKFISRRVSPLSARRTDAKADPVSCGRKAHPLLDPLEGPCHSRMLPT